MHRSIFFLVLTCGCSGVPESGTSDGGGGSPMMSAGGSGGTQVATGGSGGASTGGTGATAGSGTGGVAVGGSGGSTGGGNTGGSGGSMTIDVGFCSDALDAAAAQLGGFRAAYTTPSSIPRSAKDGSVHFVGPGDWTSGFVGGTFWYIYEYTGDEAFRAEAEARTTAIENEKFTTSHHDLGFQFMATFGNGYRLTGNASYPDVIATAAESLATRFSPTVGAIESWDFGWDFPVIIDNMMNLRLLYYVASESGDTSLRDIATAHAEKTLANHFRPNHSSFHLVDYDSSNGGVHGKQTVQGLANDSAWARGQAWGLYGFTEIHGITGREDYLEQAENIAQLMMSYPNLPEDKVPYWDYDAPTHDGAPMHRDASAAAITASALLELSGYVSEPEASTYRDFALDILRSLSSPAYAAGLGENNHFLLMHSVGHLPNDSEIDVAINYADYYYLEALLRCRALGS